MTVQFNPDLILDMLRDLPPAPRYHVAFSGGLDSSVLLHVLAAQREKLSGRLCAIHVHHGLHPQADGWQKQCEAVCRKLNIELVCKSVKVHAARGESLEATARARRYEAFTAVMQPGDCLLLAQHLDDQLETFLLQALRGAGPAGLAAMPATAPFGIGRLARPLLGVPRQALQDWARAQSLDWIEDPANQDTRFDRNYLRHEVLPKLKQRWPAAASTVARSAQHCAEALELLTAQAAEDLLEYGGPDAHTLELRSLHELPRARAKYLLRYWLTQLGFMSPPAHKLEQVFSDLLGAGADRNPCLSWTGVELRRYRELLYVQSPLPEVPEPFMLRAGEYHELGPGLGRLGLVPATTGIRADACPATGLRVSFRAGGELCRPAGRNHHRSLKKWFQELGVPPWLRSRLPVVGDGKVVMAVANLFVCEEWNAAAGQPALSLVWEQAPRLLACLADNEKRQTRDRRAHARLFNPP